MTVELLSITSCGLITGYMMGFVWLGEAGKFNQGHQKTVRRKTLFTLSTAHAADVLHCDHATHYIFRLFTNNLIRVTRGVKEMDCGRDGEVDVDGQALCCNCVAERITYCANSGWMAGKSPQKTYP